MTEFIIFLVLTACVFVEAFIIVHQARKIDDMEDKLRLAKSIVSAKDKEISDILKNAEKHGKLRKDLNEKLIKSYDTLEESDAELEKLYEKFYNN